MFVAVGAISDAVRNHTTIWIRCTAFHITHSRRVWSAAGSCLQQQSSQRKIRKNETISIWIATTWIITAHNLCVKTEEKKNTLGFVVISRAYTIWFTIVSRLNTLHLLKKNFCFFLLLLLLHVCIWCMYVWIILFLFFLLLLFILLLCRRLIIVSISLCS